VSLCDPFAHNFVTKPEVMGKIVTITTVYPITSQRDGFAAAATVDPVLYPDIEG
jgi:hypothetical protein